LSEQENIGNGLVEKVFTQCFEFSRQIVGEKKTAELFSESYRKILPYFHVLTKFQIGTDHQLMVKGDSINENEMLSFAVWIQQFLRDLKQFMVGLGHVEIEQITAALESQLNDAGFYRFYHQAQEFDY